ncbi:hypothetical protein [Zunongwangia atlantica]|uniref:Uncharacterized protein n=1 Tax=Zunongwangia atlantica 22II14-10F7 TaxID=1185767 RepID=A0A1Y1SY37_9FLAO|nr:hypothetical protein [Zunongwangia atlantica]ORL43657.1 hypothetical protein IIF7_19764 [Zunongwangia atlantica 22II14-10F7]
MEATKVEPGRNLGTYRILFIIKGVLNLCISLFGLFYVLLGIFIPSPTMTGVSTHTPFNLMSTIMVVFGSIFILFAIIMAVLTFLAAKYIGERRNATFIIVVAVINCLTGILGIVLGVLTIIEIQKPEVRALFEANRTKNN